MANGVCSSGRHSWPTLLRRTAQASRRFSWLAVLPGVTLRIPRVLAPERGDLEVRGR